MGIGRAAGVLVTLAALALSACAGAAAPAPSHPAQPAGAHNDDHGPQPEGVRPRPDIPRDWARGKRIVMQVTPSLEKSFVVACDLPVPALTYVSWGHRVTVAVDGQAITAFRRDGSGRTPLDKLELLDSDVDGLIGFLGVPQRNVPKNFGELYRTLAARGVRLVTGESVMRGAGVTRSQLDPVVEILSDPDYQHVLGDLDALLPYDDIGPQHSIFDHAPGGPVPGGGHP